MSFTFKLIRCMLRGPSITSNISRNLSKTTRITTTSTNRVLPPISCSHLHNPWVWQKNDQIRLPVDYIKPITLPNGLLTILPLIEPEHESTTSKIIEDPLSVNNDTKEAVRLIVIRRKKMKKHKLKKLRKRMKYEWAKLRQRRELKKEKEFQAGLIAQCKEAEAFSAEKYVLEKLKQAKAEPPPAFRDTPENKELMRIKKLRLNVQK